MLFTNYARFMVSMMMYEVVPDKKRAQQTFTLLLHHEFMLCRKAHSNRSKLLRFRLNDYTSRRVHSKFRRAVATNI